MKKSKKEIIPEELDENTVKTDMDKVDKIIQQKLEDLEGIGSVRLKKLYANSIYTVDDLLSHGEESVARLLEISWDDARKMIQIANESINTDEVFSSLIVNGKQYAEYRKKNIRYLTTGLEEFDEILGGYESGVIIEFFAGFGGGKTQFMIVACIMAQLPKNQCCLHCGITTFEGKLLEDSICQVKDCGGKFWKGGGFGEFGKPSRVIYIDTENSYRDERLFGIVCNRDLVLTKPQNATQKKQQAQKEPLNDEEYEKAMQYVYNVNVSRPRTSALQMMVVSNLSAIIDGDLCKVCHKRVISKEGLPTHQNDPKAKPDMELQTHDFEKDIPSNLVIIDSFTGKFRKEYEGRGTLSDRQMKLKSMVKILESVVESKNVVCLVTNQVSEKMDVMGDNIRPVGGNEIGHTFTHRIYLKKAQSMTKDKITAILVDSPNHAKNEISLELGAKGIQELTTE